MRPLDPMKIKRALTALAAGLIAGTVLVATAQAQTNPTTPAAPAPAAPGANAGLKAAKPAEAKPVAAKATPAQPTEAKPAEAKPAETKPVAAPHHAAAAESAKPMASGSATATADVKPGHDKLGDKAAEKAKGPDKKTKDGARKAYGDATAAFKAGKFDVALTKFQEAQALIPSANAEYWIAATYDKLDRKLEALAAYSTFLANEEAAKAGEDKVAEAKGRFDSLRATVPGELALTTVLSRSSYHPAITRSS